MNMAVSQPKVGKGKSDDGEAHFALAILIIVGFFLVFTISLVASLLVDRVNFIADVTAIAAVFGGWIGAVMGYYFGYQPASKALNELGNTNVELKSVREERAVMKKDLEDVDRKKRQRAKDIASPKPQRVTIHESIGDALRKMAENKVRQLLVFDEKNAYKGVLSVDDIVQRQKEGRLSLDDGFLNEPVQKILNLMQERGPRTEQGARVFADTPLHEIQKLFVDRGLSAVPVFEGDEVAGIITKTDLLKAL